MTSVEDIVISARTPVNENPALITRLMHIHTELVSRARLSDSHIKKNSHLCLPSIHLAFHGETYSTEKTRAQNYRFLLQL